MKKLSLLKHFPQVAQWLRMDGYWDALLAWAEQRAIRVRKKLAALLHPKFLRIGGYWYPRGGMPIDVFWRTGRLPAGVWLPDQGVAPYRGRG